MINPPIDVEVCVDEKEHVRVLKHEFRSLSTDEKIIHWNGCAVTRLNSINKMSGCSKKIIEDWPMYKEPEGFRLVRSDLI